MQILDWLRDGLLGNRARYKHIPKELPVSGESEERQDPSGRHDFGRRAHHPDPNGVYAFGEDAGHRQLRPKGQ